MTPPAPIGKPFTVLGEVNSTNNYAMAQVQAHLAGHGSTWFAMHQSAGKGQRGKAWNAEPGQNVMMSFVLEPGPLTVENQFILTATVALACHDFIMKYAIDQVSIKWANDIYWRDRKVGGILIENILQGKDWKYAIVGMGLNINQTSFPTALPNPVSLRQITGEMLHVVDLGKELCDYLERRWQQVLGGEYQQIMDEYNAWLYKRDERVQLRHKDELLEARVLRVNNNGQLVIYTGQERFMDFGSVEWIINKS